MVTNNRKKHVKVEQAKDKACSRILSNNRRARHFKDERKKVLIVCEGGKTEPNYFRGFDTPNVQVVTYGGQGVPSSVVDSAVQLNKKQNRRNQYDAVWVVFDRDSFTKSDIKTAYNNAKEHGILVAFSNEAFELWYLLHFEYRNTPMSRAEYKDRLSEYLGYKYEKNSLAMFEELHSMLTTAVHNAEKLCTGKKGHPINHNPYTDVYKLVDFLIACSGK